MSLGEIRMFGGNFAPMGWAFCDGRLLPISDNAALFSLIGTTYGGDGETTFALPNLGGVRPIGRNDAHPLGSSGTAPLNIDPTIVPINYIIALFDPYTDDPFTGEIRAFGFDFAPTSWLRCDGARMPISANTALFSLIGNTYGGDGRSFALPDLRATLAREPAGSSSIGYLATNFCIASSGIFPQRP